MNDPRIIVALDFAGKKQALEFARKTTPAQCRLKVGKELFTSCGPALVEELVAAGYDVFLDLKFHDIPNTVQKAASAAARLGVWMLNVHALGGSAMMRAARDGVEIVARRPFLIAVTVLTSMSEQDLRDSGIDKPLPQLVRQLARNTLDSGLDGVVCSAREAAGLRADIGDAALLVTPGIRPEWARADDQQRIVTPRQALAAGASYLVIGRPITGHADPAYALELISESIAQR
ncbi:MAG: orotidine-5'-phosphate decarboxylase [Gammaproteobacteria bacterium]|nr:orotidine-5'-phosphate decarboxylase [Gammaproteobacteria bacterium]